MCLQTLQIISPPVILERKTLEFAPQPKKNKSLWPVKDIHDFDRVHGDWLEHAAVTLVVHHHHEEVAAGDLLDDEGPADHGRRQKTRKEGRRKRSVSGLAKQTGGKGAHG